MAQGDLLLPVGRVIHTGVPRSLTGAVTGGYQRRDEMDDIAYRLGGRSARPQAPILIYGPNNMPILVVGDGAVEAAELEDIAQETLGLQEEQHAQDPNAAMDAFRDRHGLMRREDVPAAIQNAIRDRITKHRRNPVSDPFRQPHKLRGTFKGIDLPKGEQA